MGGASRGWRPLAAGAALCLSPSLPPARRRSEAELPASPSWSRSWWCALAATASLHRETPRGPSPGIPASRRRQPRGRRGRGDPSPAPLDRDRPGPAAARVSVRRRAFAPGGVIVGFPRAQEGVEDCLRLSVCRSESFLSRICRRQDSVLRPTGHPRLPGIALGPAGLSWGEGIRPPGPPVGGDRSRPPCGFRTLDLHRGTFHLCLEQSFPIGPWKPPRHCSRDLPSPIPYSFLEVEAF